MGEKNTIKKIVIIGPESTGKSTLCRQLAAHFNTLWCPEYAR
ncbi:MAG: ATP-binding protein, partial [Chitinophagaceae bacterium]|nr:ATP-binding protein [Chitinophagaceae bacterium]